jgi:Platelet-activating factor acetylhydrolase, isoform II
MAQNAAVAADGTFPAPTGSQQVGRLALDLTDERRRDPYARREAKRRLGVWVWYPADPPRGARPARYLPGWWRVLGPVWGFRPSRVRVRAVEGAPIAAAGGPFPILVFSPSGNPPHFYTALFEEIASHGYVVAGIAHTYETIPITALPGGGVRLLNLNSLAGAFSIPGKRPYQEDLRERTGLIDVKAADIRFVLGELAEMNDRHEILAGRLDLGTVGAFGHSFGGAAASEACRLDQRLRAGASIDGGLWKAPEDVAASGPFLQLFGEHPEYVIPCAEAVNAKYFATQEYCQADRRTTIGAWQALHERAQPGRSVLVLGAGHASFIDWPLLPLWRVSVARRGLGTPAPGVVWRVASDYLLGFFDEHIRGRPGRLPAGESADDRVRIDDPAALFA